MAVLIPSLSASVSRMTRGERRLAERLEQKLDSDYLLWYDVPVGPKRSHPDFIVLHPLRGLLILEVKDWRLETIQKATRGMWEIVPGGELKSVNNPFEQARHYAEEVVDALKRDPQLVQERRRFLRNLITVCRHRHDTDAAVMRLSSLLAVRYYAARCNFNAEALLHRTKSGTYSRPFECLVVYFHSYRSIEKMAKYMVTIKYGNPGESKNTSQIITIEAGSESAAMQLAVNKFKSSNAAYKNKEAEAVKIKEI